MLTNQQWAVVAFTWTQFQRKWSRNLTLIWVWKWFIQDDQHISQGPISWYRDKYDLSLLFAKICEINPVNKFNFVFYRYSSPMRMIIKVRDVVWLLPWNRYLGSGRFNISLFLTHWGRVTHVCVSKLTIIGSDNGLSPGRRQAIIWTNAGILLIRPLGTNFSEILIYTISFKKIHLKMWSGNCGHFVSALMS